MKKVMTVLLMMTMLVMMLGIACADNYVLDTSEDGVWDFCVYNTWGDSYIDAPIGDVTNVRMTINVTNFAGDPINCKLYSVESTSWATAKSEAQTISGDGTYVFELTYGAAFAGDTLCTLYIKDLGIVATADDPDGLGGAESAGSASIECADVEWNFVADDGGADDGAADETPKTADAMNIVIVAGVAVLALGSIVFSATKKVNA